MLLLWAACYRDKAFAKSRLMVTTAVWGHSRTVDEKANAHWVQRQPDQSGFEVSATACQSEANEIFEGGNHEMFVELQNIMGHMAAKSTRFRQLPGDAPIMHCNGHQLQAAQHAQLESEYKPVLDVILEPTNSFVEEQVQTHLHWQDKVQYLQHCDKIDTFANSRGACPDSGKLTRPLVDFKRERDASMLHQTNPIPLTADQGIDPCCSRESDQHEATCTAAEQASVEIKTIKSVFRERADKRKAALKAR